MPADPSPTFDSLLATLASRGWSLLCLQTAYTGGYQCNLADLDAGTITIYAHGETPLLALAAALSAPWVEAEPAASPTIILANSDGVDLRALLAKLTPSSAPLTRRLGK